MAIDSSPSAVIPSLSISQSPLSGRWTVCISWVLLWGTVALCLATTDVGFTRDESFYFRYAESYQRWFEDVADAETPDAVARALGRKKTVPVWKGNFEHPPLMKTLFGFSWRVFARKDRDVRRVKRVKGKGVHIVLQDVGHADGFEVGQDAYLLRPLVSGVNPAASARELALGKVITRNPGSAVVAFDSVQYTRIQKACSPRPGDSGKDIIMTGCQVREDRALAIMSESTAMRLPGFLGTGLAVMLTFLLGIRLFSWQAGLFGALAFLFVPRHFFHAHMACFDMAVVAATLFVLYAFLKSLEDRRWALIAGIAWGLALLTKHNAFFLPVPLMMVWLYFGRNELYFRRQGWRFSLKLPKLPLAFLIMPVVALPMLFVFWPRFWYDPFIALTEYFGFHLQHDHYFQWYFGQPLQVPPFPFDFPFSLTVHTMPEAFVFLFAVGFLLTTRVWTWGKFWTRLGQAPSETEKNTFFAALNGLFPIFLIALPTVPIFGGVKHWMTGMPFLMLFAGYGLHLVLRRTFQHATRPWASPLGAVASAALLLLPAASASINSLPFGTGYYNSVLTGGVRGAADRQMMRIYWSPTAAEGLAFVNRHAPRGARVYFQNTPSRAVKLYQRDGLLRHDIKIARGPHGAAIALIEPQKSFSEEADLTTRKAMRVAGPYRTVDVEGVPFLRIYVRPGLLQKKTVRVKPRTVSTPKKAFRPPSGIGVRKDRVRPSGAVPPRPEILLGPRRSIPTPSVSPAPQKRRKGVRSKPGSGPKRPLRTVR